MDTKTEISSTDQLIGLVDRLHLSENEDKILIEIDNLIKSDETLRKHIPLRFYSRFLNYLQSFIIFDSSKHLVINFTNTLTLILKCLKNSAATFKPDNTEAHNSELEIINLLNVCLKHSINNNNFEIQPNDEKYGLKKNFFLFTLQYIFNLIQGNRYLTEIYIKEWTELCFKIIAIRDVDIDIFNVCPMIIYYGCIEKLNQEQLVENLSKNLAIKDYFQLIDNFMVNEKKYFEQIEDTDESEDFEIFAFLKESHATKWSYKLIDYIQEKFILPDDLKHYTLKSRINNLRLFKNKLIVAIENIDKTDVPNYDLYYSIDTVANLANLHENSSTGLIDFINKSKNEDKYLIIMAQNFNTLLDYLNEIKILSSCLSDILSMKEIDSILHLKKQNLSFVQERNQLFGNICHLFKEINTNKELQSFFKANNKESKEIYNYFKCELIRLIGILVYENQQNQRTLVETDCLHIISNNLNIDIENPFFREWSIVALKHILSCLDHK